MNIRPVVAWLIALATISPAAEQKDFFGPYDFGYVAYCRQSVVDELQVVGEPRRIAASEIKQLTQILNAEESWGRRNPDGTISVSRSSCIPYYDFKYVFLLDGKVVASIRLCTHCRQFHIQKGESYVGGGMMREEAFRLWRARLDEWFPGWPQRSDEDRKAWYKRPNQSPEPTAMSVTPPAAQESRQP